MDFSYTKKRILQETSAFITRNGIRAFRVEMLAREIGISKRTVYRLFPTKAGLLKECIRQFNETALTELHACISAKETSSLRQTANFIETYIHGLYQRECIFWKELRRSEFEASYLSVRQEWQIQGEKLLENGKLLGDIRTDTDIPFFMKRLLTGLFESRLDNEPYSQQFQFFRIMLRGIASEPDHIRLQ